MAKPRIVVFSGANTTIANSPPLVTSNKGRLPGERLIPGRFDHLVPQLLYEPATVKIRKFSAHPLEEDSAEAYHDNGKDYYEATLLPEDGPYLLPYMARRKDGTKSGTPFEASDLTNSDLNFGGRQTFYPDGSRIFSEIDRTISGRSVDGEGSILDRKANFDFVRVLPSGGYTKKGEVSGVDYFPYRPEALRKAARTGDLAKVANVVQREFDTGKYAGGIWLDGSPQLEETIYWLSLLIDTELPIVGTVSQRTHGMLANDGDRNIVDAVNYIASGKGGSLGAVAVVDQCVISAREVKKGDDRPGNYKAVGGHGGVLGSIKSEVAIWYLPAYKHTKKSEVNIKKIPDYVTFEGEEASIRIDVKDKQGLLRAEAIPHIHIVKYSSYSQTSEKVDYSTELDILSWINLAKAERTDVNNAKMHGIVFEGSSPYAKGSPSQIKALEVAALSGLPVVRVGRSDPGGKVPTNPNDLTIEGSNLDANKARILLMASMLKLGGMPIARDPNNPTSAEKDKGIAVASKFQEIFETH